MADIERINPDTLPDAGTMGYAQVTTCAPGKMVFISGQVAWTPGGDPPPEGLGEQAQLAAENLEKALEGAGASLDNLVSARMFIVDMTPEMMNQAATSIITHFAGRQIAFTAIGCTSLAAPDLKIELEAIAVV